MSPNRFSFPAVAVVLLALGGGTLVAADKTVSDRYKYSLPLSATGRVAIENPVGSVEVVGSDGTTLDIEAVRTVRGGDDDAIAEGRSQTKLLIGGDERARILRTEFGLVHRRRWAATVSYKIRVPRSVDVNIVSHSGEGIRLTNLSGNVAVKNVNGDIRLDSIIGTMTIDSINGDVVLVYPLSPSVNAVLSSVNGMIEIVAPRSSRFVWIAQTLRGDIRSSLPIRGTISRGSDGMVYRGAVNGAPSPVLRTTTMTGAAYLVSSNTEVARSRSLLPSDAQLARMRPPTPEVLEALRQLSATMLLQPPSASTFVAQQNVQNGDFQFETNLGNVFFGEIRGDADITTHAGEIVLGRVQGSCAVTSGGGPINLGDIFGTLTARTTAGDIHVRSARRGGLVATEGGNVQVIYAGGPIELYSGGGDVEIRQASSRVQAETKSGDIFITIDPKLRSSKIVAQSVGGNVILTIPPGFAADLEIVIETSSPEVNRIHADLSGLTVTRAQVGPKTRLRAVGKINGGGEKVVLMANEGDVQIRQVRVPPIIVVPGN